MIAILDKNSDSTWDSNSEPHQIFLHVISPPPPYDYGDNSYDALKAHVRASVDDSPLPVAGYEYLSFGRVLWGMAGCESRWEPFNIRNNNAYGDGFYNPANWIPEYEAGFFQYQHYNIPPHPPTGVTVPWSPNNTWGGTPQGSSGGNIWNGHTQIDATIWKIGPGQNINAWSCWNSWGWADFAYRW